MVVNTAAVKPNIPAISKGGKYTPPRENSFGIKYTVPSLLPYITFQTNPKH